MRLWLTLLSVASAMLWALLLSALLDHALNWQAQASSLATTWFVDSVNGDNANDCLSAGTACETIGKAIQRAADGDTIKIAAGLYREYNLEINKPLTLLGAGNKTTILDGGSVARVLKVSNPATISDVTIRGGSIVTPAAQLFDTGGGALFSSATLTLRNSVLISNSAVGPGGGIFNLGALTIQNSDVLSNSSGSNGGGIYNYGFGSLTISNSEIGWNRASGQDGGGIEANRPMTLTDVLIRNNQSAVFGGGLKIASTALLNRVTLVGNRTAAGAALFATSGAITLRNVTVSQNIASNNYGGLYLSGPTASLLLQNSTIANNTRTNSAGAGVNGVIIGNGASVRVVNTIFAYNEGRNCGGTESNWVSSGHNLATDFRCGLSQTGDQPGVDPLLGPLANNGGDTLTHALLPGSPAIDAGTNAECQTSDQRGSSRPIDGDNNSVATCDIGAYEVRSQLSIADVTITEGTGATTNAVFTVTLAPPSTQQVTVKYATAAGSARSPSDFTAATGTLTFSPGQRTKKITVIVKGDSADEPDEQFTVKLSNATNADVVDGAATGLIIDNDSLPALTISDATLLEGNSGSTKAAFAISLSPASTAPVSVNYSVSPGTAVAGSDYTAVSGSLAFNPGQTSKTVEVPVLGDLIDEGEAETFSVKLAAAVNANVTDGTGLGTITDDDSAALSQTFGPTVVEGDSGLTPANFIVTLTPAAAFVVTVDYEVSSGVGETGAKEGEDFVDTAGTLTFQPGVTQQTFTVMIIGDEIAEQEEIFQTLISNGSVPIIANGNSGRITDDDANGGNPDDIQLYLPLVQR